MDHNEREQRAREFLHRMLYPDDAVSRGTVERVQCERCGTSVRLDEAEFWYDENGDFIGFECETHI